MDSKMNKIITSLSISLIVAFTSSAGASEQSGPIAHTPHEMKVEIGKLLNRPDLKNYGEVSSDFNKAMKDALSTHTAHILASQLTADNIVTLRKVGQLKLQVDNATDASMARIGQLTNLISLNLSNQPVTDAGLQNLQGLQNLETLFLNNLNLTDAGLANVQHLQKLKGLDLISTHITPAGLQNLHLPALEWLNVGGVQLGDAWLQHVSTNFPKLTWLSLDNTQITDAGLQNLQGSPIEQLFLMNNQQITDAGIQHLHNLPNLTLVNLSGTAVTDAAINALKQKFPNLTVIKN